MFIRRVSALILLLVSLFSVSVYAVATQTIVINSYKVGTEGKTTDEFIEVYNNGRETINIEGWQLAKKTASGNLYKLVTSFPSCEIRAGESIIVGHKDSTASPDMHYSTDYSLSDDNTIILFSDAGRTVIDKVGYGKAGDFENKAAPTAGTDIWTRTGGVDTGDNFNDFRKAVASVDLSGIAISEIMPSPESGEEWVEIYNAEVTKDIGGLVIQDKLGSVKKFTVPTGTIILENAYLVFYKDKTGITLNDDGDGIILSDPSGNIIDDSGESYGKAIKGGSYAFDGSAWRWTAKPTPNARNLISAGGAATVTSKKRSTLNTSEGSAAKKGAVPKAEVLGTSEKGGISDVFGNKSKGAGNDQLFGYILIALAVFGGAFYTIFVNKEKLRETFIKERERYYKAWTEAGENIKGWRSLFALWRFGRRKDTIRKGASFRFGDKS